MRWGLTDYFEQELEISKKMVDAMLTMSAYQNRQSQVGKGCRGKKDRKDIRDPRIEVKEETL